MARNTVVSVSGRRKRRSPRQLVVSTSSSELASTKKDGIIFGDNCERRVFFPKNHNSNNSSTRIVSAIDEEEGRGVLSAVTPDPLSALGLLTPSPYGLLKRAALLELKQATRGRRLTSSPEQQHQQHQAQEATTPCSNQPNVDVVCGGNNINNNKEVPPKQPCRQRRQNEPETSMTHHGGGGRRNNNNTRIRPRSRESASSPHNKTTSGGTALRVAEIYSPHWHHQRSSSGVYPQRRDIACNYTTAEASASSYHHRGCDEDQSVVALLDTLRAGEARIIREATRLRREADPSVLIRRFLRSSG